MKKTQSSELGESNIFDEFYDLIEKHRLKTSSKFSIENLYNNLSEFDLAYQKFSTINNLKTNGIVHSFLHRSLYYFLVLFTVNGFSDRPFYWSFNRFIQFSTLLLNNSNNITNKDFYMRNISVNFPSITNGEFAEILGKANFNFNIHSPEQFDHYYPILKKAEKDISIELGIIPKSRLEKERNNFKLYSSNFEVIHIHFDSSSNTFITDKLSYEMEIRLEISNSDNDAQKLIQSFYFILTALSNIENVKLEIEEITVGSLFARLRLLIENIVAKEETKAVLETTKESVTKWVSAGTVSHYGTQKTIKEIEILDQELNRKPSLEENKLINALKLEKQALENEQLRIKNAREKLELIEKISDLATKGVLEADDIKIDINGILYLLKSGDNCKEIKVDIDSIT